MPDAGDTTNELTDETTEDTADGHDDDEQTYPAKVVKDLRKESAGYRDRAKTAETRVDELSRALFTAKVAATGKLADPTDLPFDAEALEDDDKLAEVIDGLTDNKPHLKARRVTGSVGQGERGKGAGPQDFSGLFQAG